MELIDKLKAIGDGFRASRGTTQEYSLDEMAELAAVPVGVGGAAEDLDTELTEQEELIAQLKTTLEGKAGGGGTAVPVLQEKTVTPTKEAQEVTADTGYTGLSKVGVNPIPDEYIIPKMQLKRADPSSATQWIEPDEGYDGLAAVVVKPIPEEYIVPSGTQYIFENGTFTVREKETVEVQVDDGTGFLDNSLTSINSSKFKVVGYACRGLSSIKTVNLPNATSIGTYAFYYCTGITFLSAPKVTSLNTYAFYVCTKIPEVNFPVASSIPSSCFYQCSAMTKADFGAAKSIAASAFAYSEALVTLILRRSDAICTVANTNAFTGTPIEDGTGYVYVPKALLSDDDATKDYRRATNWSTFQFRAIEDYPDICG